MNSPIPKEREVHITSLVVQAVPERVGDVAARLDGTNGLEVNRTEERGKLVVLLETPSLADVTDQVDAIRGLPGVINVTLVYHQTEDAALLDQPVPMTTPPA